METKHDFSGWATKSNLRCSDGRVILRDAFKENDGDVVPLVWMHQHNDPFNILGHALLENRDDGVYAYCDFNNTENGQLTKELVQHGDVLSLSIFANQLEQEGRNVKHGVIREVSLVLAGANPRARIDNVIRHGDDLIELPDDEGVLFNGTALELAHAEKGEAASDKQSAEPAEKAEKNASENENEAIGQILDTLTEKQKNAVAAAMVLMLDEEATTENKNNENHNDEEDSEMKHNVFDQDREQTGENTLSHSQMETIITDAKRYGSLKDSFLAHAQEYGIENIEYLFPDAKTLNNRPEFIKRDTGWVEKVMNGVHHTPFSRVKSVFANLTEDDARAKGYTKGNLKLEEVFSLLKRTTDPTTIYKKQKMDRDDAVDITDFDVVAWLKTEMRMMLNEELARAILVGDGRLASSDEKIDENKIRPIYNDAELYTIRAAVSVASNASDDDKAKAFIKACIKERKKYKGSGDPTLWTTEDMLNSMLLLQDTTGRDIYTDVGQLAKKLRVKEIVSVPVMEGRKGVNGGDLLGLIVNLNDYNVGADKGGAVNMFEDFDIDYNQQKYLIETRCSGAMVKPYGAIALELATA